MFKVNQGVMAINGYITLLRCSELEPHYHLQYSAIQRTTFFLEWGPRGVIVKAMYCGIVVSEFVLQSRYYVHFRANTPGKSMNPLILPAMG